MNSNPLAPFRNSTTYTGSPKYTVNNHLINDALYPIDTGRKLNVHKTFRRRLGRLLNVLCTFSLRPVSSG